jgi:hypothetical protein
MTTYGVHITLASGLWISGLSTRKPLTRSNNGVK